MSLWSLFVFLLLTLGFVFSSFSDSFGVKLDCLRLFFFLEVGLYFCELPSWNCFYWIPQILVISYLCFYLSLGISFFILPLSSSVTHWIFSSMLFNLQIFFQFYSWNWFLISYHCGQKRFLMISTAWIYWDLFCGQCDISWRIFQVHLKRMFILLLLDEVFCIWLLSSSGLKFI